MPAGRGTRLAVAVAAAFVIAAMAWALVQAVAAPTGEQRVELAGAAAVSIEVDQGDVDVRAAATAGRVSARAEVRAPGIEPARTAAAVGGEARLSWSCRFWTTCRVDVRADVPRDLRVRVRTSFGDIRVAGPVGDVDLETGSGDVEATSIEGGRATVRARSGGAMLAFDRRPSDVDVEVTSGDITLDVPAGAYRITAETRAGEVVLDGVRDDPAARGGILLDTTAGDVTVRGR